jgi:AhpD family alkylhydroperoxidase
MKGLPMTRYARMAAVAICLASSGYLPAAADDTLQAARADMTATLGPEALLLDVLPDAFLAATWAQMRALLVDNDYTIPVKYRALIGLAVSSQIPCAYCIYADTSDARVAGATEQEIKEAIMFAALTRQGSTLLNGNMVDLDAFKAEIDAGAAAMREAWKQPAPSQ